jgi:outer membrane protein
MTQLTLKRPPGGATVSAVALLIGGLALTGCVHEQSTLYGGPATAASPAAQWSPPPQAAELLGEPAATEPASIPEDLLAGRRDLTLSDIVDISLRNSPRTAAAWARARSAAASFGSERGSYFPQVTGSAELSRVKGSFANGSISYTQKTLSPAIQMSWLLFDFGGRKAGIDETREALIAADWTHNATIQAVVLQVEEAYYQYVTAKALAAAQEATFKETEASLDAARERHKAGVATIADVLQATTARAQAKLVLDGLQGEIQTTRGALATAMGLPANTPYDIGSPSDEMSLAAVTESIDQLLEKAERLRPDLAAARAEARKAEAHLRNVRAEAYPSIVGTASIGRNFYGSLSTYGDVNSAAVGLRVPLFTGFSHTFDVREAEANHQAAAADLQSLRQEVALEVWTSYYSLKTAEQRVKTSEDLFASATESHDVALGRYKAGVGSILDLLAAQSALEDARAQRVQARAAWFVSLARLAHDTGTLDVSGSGVADTAPISVEKKERP